jgi:hypothetical protein
MILVQMSAKAGIKKHGKEAERVLLKEFARSRIWTSWWHWILPHCHNSKSGMLLTW